MIIQILGNLIGLVRWREPWFRLEQQSCLDASLVELFRGEYALTIAMPTKDIFGNWTERYMCGDYFSMNK
jgi:hypothetical protein